MLLLLLNACFQVDQDAWKDWEETHSNPENTNALPVISELVISPADGVYNDSVLSCSATAEDPEDGSLDVEYAWLIDAAQITEGDTINLALYEADMPGQVVGCVATATDSFGETISIESTVEIENRDPTVDSIVIDNQNPEANALLRCDAVISDRDGDEENVAVSYLWDAGSGTIGTEQTLQLSPDLVAVGDDLSCTATAADAHGGGGQTQTTVVIANSLPEIQEVLVSPNADVDAQKLLSCSIAGADLNDADELLQRTFSWKRYNDAQQEVSWSVQVPAEETLQLSPTLVQPGDYVRCEGILTDQNEGSDTMESELRLIGNIPPLFAQSAVITPDTGVFVGTQLQCAATGEDPDDGSITPSYRWLVNGTEVFVGESYTVSAAHVDVGQSLECIASVTDSHDATETSTVSVVIENSPPVVESVQISPENPESNAVVECIYSASDPDEETLTPSYSWTIDGASVGEASTLDLSTLSPAVGAELGCVVIVSDLSGGEDSNSATQTVQNSPPIFDGPIAITPDAGVVVGTALQCSVTASDPEDGVLQPTYRWTVDSVQVAEGENYTVNAEDIAVGETLECIASVTDSLGATQTTTNVVTIENSPPLVSDVIISPSVVFNDTEIYCGATIDDRDDDATVNYAWYAGEELLGTEGILDLGQLNPRLNPNQQIQCIVSVADSAEEAQASSVVSLENRSPSAPAVSIDGGFGGLLIAGTATDVLCSGADSVDPDGDEVSYVYEWILFDSPESIYAATLPAAETTFGDLWRCSVTAVDDYEGTAEAFVDVEIINSAPEISNTSIDWGSLETSAYNDSVLTCSADISDPDGETLEISYTWRSDFTVLGEEATLNLAELINLLPPGSPVSCTVEVLDAENLSQDVVSISLGNRPPMDPIVALSVSTGLSDGDGNIVAYTNDAIGCTATAVDLDYDQLSYSYEWSSDQGGFVLDAVLPATSTTAGETWTCTATAEDPSGESSSSFESTIIENSPPEISSVAISSPDLIRNNSVVTCEAVIDDPDEPLTPTYSWSIGDWNLDVTTPTIDLGSYHTGIQPGGELICTATATDGSGVSATPQSAQKPIRNRRPSIQEISIEWDSLGYSANPSDAVDLTCEASVLDEDGDVDSLSINYMWQTIDETQDFLGAELPASETQDGETWICTVTVSDGNGDAYMDDGTIVSSSAEASATAVITVRDWSKCDASTQLSDADYRFYGEDTGDRIGRVSPAGDVDGDGLDDFIIGAPNTYGDNASGTNLLNTGTIYLFLGSSLASNPVIAVENADYTFYAESGYESAGTSIAGGDFDGDGQGDLLIASPRYSGTTANEGRVYLILGASIDASTPSSVALSTADYIFEGGTAEDWLGDSIAFADVDGDTKDDVLIGERNGSGGSQGYVHLFKASSLLNQSSTSIAISNADRSFGGESAGDEASKVASAGDLNGDGNEDILIGAPNHSSAGYTQSGKVYVISGTHAINPDLGSVESISTVSSATIVGQGDYKHFGRVMTSGDFDGDSQSDIAIGEPLLTAGGNSGAGGVRIFYGSLLMSSSGPTLSSVNASITLEGEYEGDQAGESLASAGDIDLDGQDDLIIGSKYNSDTTTEAGKAYVFLTSSVVAGTTTYSLSEAAYAFTGEGSEEYAGSFVNRAGDVNGDGVQDLLISAEGFDNGGTGNPNYGQVGLFLGCE